MNTTLHTVAFIGGGNMARSLIGGLVARGMAPASIRVSEPVDALRDALAKDFGVTVFADNAHAVEGADTWIFGVKPQVMRDVCEGLAPVAQSAKPLVVSIAAGITTTQLERWLGGALPIVRTMPNTPALLGAGVTGLFANARVDAAGRARTQALLEATGRCVWIDEEARMDAVTAVSGSGPAYIFLVIEALSDAGVKVGLPRYTAQKLAAQTVLGSAKLLIETGIHPGQLKDQVTSPGGTAIAGLATLEAGGLRTCLINAVEAATRRARELGDQFLEKR